MPFKRKGLCRVDAIKCANMLDEGVPVKEIAKLLSTTPEYVEKFTHKALNANNKKVKAAEDAAKVHAAETKETASVIANAAKEILHEGPTRITPIT